MGWQPGPRQMAGLPFVGHKVSPQMNMEVKQKMRKLAAMNFPN